jgi:3-phosphoshikimate 1-carboxyvinyltransferase
VSIDAYPLYDIAIFNGGIIQLGLTDSHYDHQMIIAFAIVGGVAKTPVIIKICTNVIPFFPTFVTTANKINLAIKDMCYE